MAKFQPPRATRDYPPDKTGPRNHVRSVFSRVVESYGFQAIETPTFERIELFSARSGPEIKSSMLTFHCDHEEFALRPEMTAPVCRLVSSGELEGVLKPYKFYYIAPCFRYCPPRSGRYREFTQAGIEYLGEPRPMADAEVIAAACRIMRSLGLAGFSLKIGNIGIFRDLLAADLDADDSTVVIGHLDTLSSIDEKCRLFAKTGDPALLDELKMERMDLAAMQADTGYSGPYAISGRPSVTGEELATVLPDEAEATFRRIWSVQELVSETASDLLIKVSRLRGPLEVVHQQARALLQGTKAVQALEELISVCGHVKMYDLGEFEVVLGIARGFTFYTSTVFEISSGDGDGGQKFCGGGRYDKLVEEFGGPSLPSAGCAFRFDSLVEAFEANGSRARRPAYQVVLLADSQKTLPAAVETAELLRAKGLRVGVDIGPQALPSVRDCRDRGTEWVALLSGPDSEGPRAKLSNGSVVDDVALDADVLAARINQPRSARA